MRNNTLLLNLHAALQRYSNKTLDVFGGVYFMAHGVPFSAVALMWSASFLIRFFLRPISVWLTGKIGLKYALVLGTLASSGLFLVFNYVDGVNIWLAVFAVYLAFYDILYWLPFHAFYAVSGKENRRGREVAIRVGLINVVQIIVPLGGALIASKYGFNYLYLSAMFCMMLSVLPVLMTQDKIPGAKMTLGNALKEIDKRGLVMSVGDGAVTNGHHFIWTIVMFGLAGSLVNFGALMTVELVLVAVISLVIGRGIDNGKARWAARLGIATLLIAMISRSSWITDPSEIILSSVIVAIGCALLDMPYTVSMYNFAQKSQNALWFHFFAEAGWDIGGFAVLIVAAGLAVLGVPLQYLVLLGLPGLWIIDRVLSKARQV